jgi:hypothetical protein
MVGVAIPRDVKVLFGVSSGVLDMLNISLPFLLFLYRFLATKHVHELNFSFVTFPDEYRVKDSGRQFFLWAEPLPAIPIANIHLEH